MINTHWLELPLSRTNSHGSKAVRAIEVRLYFIFNQLNNNTFSRFSCCLVYVEIEGDNAEQEIRIRLCRADTNINALRPRRRALMFRDLPSDSMC